MMVVSDDIQTVPRILLAADTAHWRDHLERHLREAHYQLYTVHDADVNSLRQEDDHPHGLAAILASLTDDSLAWFAELREQSAAPVLMFIVDADDLAAVDDHALALADAILPPDPIYIDAQLQILLRQRDETNDLHQHITQLEHEIVEQRRMTSEMELLKNAIVRNVSHELRTPLLQVKSAVSLIAEDTADKKLISYAENATARLEMHVKNITMLGSSLDISLNPIILRDAVQYARRNLKRIWQRRNTIERIQLDIEPGLPPVLADKQGLSTVLQLLLDNALKFSEDSNEAVIIKAYQEDEATVTIGVSDSGIGIAPEERQTIFDTFYQVDSSSTRRYGGTGVGLAIVKIILDKHDAVIHVDSEPDVGSTFWFRLSAVDISNA